MANIPTLEILQNSNIDTLERLIVFCAFSLKNALNDPDNQQASILNINEAISIGLERSNQRSGKLNLSVNFVINKLKYYSNPNLIESVYSYTDYESLNYINASEPTLDNPYLLDFNNVPGYIVFMEQLFLWALDQWNISISLAYYDNILKTLENDPNGEQKIIVHNNEANYTESFDINNGIYKVDASLPFDWLLYKSTYNILDCIYQIALAPTDRIITPISIVDEKYNPLVIGQEIAVNPEVLKIKAINDPPQYGSYAQVVDIYGAPFHGIIGEAPVRIKADNPDWYMSWESDISQR